ncbi:hypothetical protein M9H77_04496 [Catharanthus roseus]|uniref:Uncharacterized protein n=1 Tax=Catharanthus roseus TaxID=4058 RepID=A0ACC0CEN5_CATRO|nr:hypothetical protein M9H77_04496 [Catharanthus roseus]
MATAGRSVTMYSELQTSRIKVSLPLPSVLKSSFSVVDGPPSSAAGNPDEIAKLFPSLFGQPSAMLKPCDPSGALPDKSLKIGVVLSGGQAPGGHNVISGIFDYLLEQTKASTLYGFRGGPAGLMHCKYVQLTTDFIYPYRNQFKQAEETARKLDLDGIVIIGGDDSNTNACLLAENFRGKNMKTRVIGCPKTIDGDLKCKEVPTSFGFDTACKIYAEMIGNVMTDARSTGKYYHFVRLMGRAASHITLECALQTHPNITIIGEEVQQLIAELNEILANDVVDSEGSWKKKLRTQSQQLFELLPEAIQEQLLLERDPHGNVQGRCGLPSNFDSNYCYALGYGAGALLHSGKSGLISSVGNLGAPIDQWTVGGTALTSLMDVERRHGKFKPVIKKAMVELQGAPFKKFASMREDWAMKNRYVSPGPIQFLGHTANDINHTLMLELGAQA